jgi:acyl-CoA dehydrogenase
MPWRNLVFAMLMNWMKAKKLLPRISDTEREALEAGTVWIDGEFFGGNPDFGRILASRYDTLPPEEQAFLDGPAEELCRMIDPHRIALSKRVPDAVLDFIRSRGFMGLLIPKEYGGKGFSTLGISSIIAKVMPYSSAVGSFIVIPNSLGAAELIVHYGTQAQKEYYLPRLARGEFIPCFGLTEPTAGSDAASIRADAEVFRDGDGATRLRLNFRKRYITLGPVANLATIACRLRDPQNLLGKGEHPGITCVLVHAGTPGFRNGDHHDPIGDPFYNGPLIGQDVIVPVDDIVGGPARAGQGWRMLMEQLAGGRAVSLPAGAIGGAKIVAAATGAYSMVRQQFGLQIGRMEGVEDKIARIAAMTYLLDGARIFACSAIDAGEHPPVVSSVLKAYSTELYREIITAGMDVFAGAGIMQGPNNILGRGYAGTPVGITVEGANILTRTLMIFGQGATRCHPYAFKVVTAVERTDVPAFRKALLGWIGHFIVNMLRSVVRYLTRGASAGTPVAGPTAHHYRRLAWASTRFAVLTDLAMFTIGSRLKARGRLSGRYADVLAWLVLGASALRRYEAEGRRDEDLPLVHYACDYACAQIQCAFEDIYRNFRVPVLGFYLRTLGLLLLRVNPLGASPADALSHRAAQALQRLSGSYRRLTAGIFFPAEDGPGFGRLMHAFRRVEAAHAAAEAVILAQRNGRLPRGPLPAEVADTAVREGIISAAEAELLKLALSARLKAIEVDTFRPDQYFVELDSPQPTPTGSGNKVAAPTTVETTT